MLCCKKNSTARTQALFNWPIFLKLLLVGMGIHGREHLGIIGEVYRLDANSVKALKEL